MKKTKAKKPAPKARAPKADAQAEALREKKFQAKVLKVCKQKQLRDMLADMHARSIEDTQRQAERVERLKGPRDDVSDVEIYGYTTFPAPMRDYLEYIKSTKNNLRTWGDLKEFVKTTDSFWKTMRDQSCNIALTFAKEQIEGVNRNYFDKVYLNRIIRLYISETKREMEYNSPKLISDIVEIISDYGEHEQEVAFLVRSSERRGDNDE
jgi:hypothetical protein